MSSETELSTAGSSSVLDWRWALPRIVLVFLVTRLLVFGVAVAVEATQPPPPAGLQVDKRPLLGSLTAWDGRYYLGIAQEGYHAEPVFGPFVDYAFFPLYPIAVRAASVLTLGDTALAAVLVANAAFALALAALFALSVRYLTPERSIRSLWYLALAPGAIAFALAYSDSLFLLFAVAAFLAAETKHPWLAGIAYALATLARPPGILLGLPLLILYLQRDGLRPTRSWVPLFLGPLALAVFFGYLWWLTGDPWARFHAQDIWLGSIAPDALPADSYMTDNGSPVTLPVSDALLGQLATALLYGIFVFHLLLFLFFRVDRIHLPYVTVAALSVIGVFNSGWLLSAPRYLAAAWPFDWVLGSRQRRWVHAIVLPAFALLQITVAWLAFRGFLAP